MNHLTSMADFYIRVKDDDRYKLVAILAYKTAECVREANYDEAMKWIEDWITNRREGGVYYHSESDNTCSSMVNYLNKMMDKIPIFSSKLISPNNINTFTKIENVVGL